MGFVVHGHSWRLVICRRSVAAETGSGETLYDVPGLLRYTGSNVCDCSVARDSANVLLPCRGSATISTEVKAAVSNWPRGVALGRAARHVPASWSCRAILDY